MRSALLLFLFVATTSPASAAKIVFLIGEREYETNRTLPAFADEHLTEHECVILNASAEDRNVIPGMEAVDDADLLVISLRRRALPAKDLERIRRHVAGGKPVLSLRTGNHGFSLRGDEPPEGHATWERFDAEVLGGTYKGHLKPEASYIMPSPPSGLQNFKTGGTLYIVEELADDVTVWAEGRPVDAASPAYPVFWSRTTEAGGRVVSTTLGHPTAFDRPEFVALMRRAFAWSLAGKNLTSNELSAE